MIDPYFRPILISSLISVLLNTVLILPFAGAPLFSYFVGGFVSTMIFKSAKEDKFHEVKMFDSAVLGIGTGVISGSVLAIIISLKLQNADIKKMIIETINEQLQMNSQAEIPLLTELEPGFYMLTAIITVIMASIMCLFGSTIALAFVNKEKK